MSEFSNTAHNRLLKLKELAYILLETGNAHTFITQNQDFISTVVPADFITLFDEIVIEEFPMDSIKTLTNKLLNIFHTTLKSHNRLRPQAGSFLETLEKNNSSMEALLLSVKNTFIQFSKDNLNNALKTTLLRELSKIEPYIKYYEIKENVLFPILEQKWDDYRCIQIMWSFHDDIRRNLKLCIDELQKENADISIINKLMGLLFFNILAIKFREEYILFPEILKNISSEELEKLNSQALEIGYPYYNPAISKHEPESTPQATDGYVDLGTGKLKIEEIKLIFNHLPVDITYVDEHDKVRFFSTPPKRIFPRTTAVLGREVRNCHPPESVHVVEDIIQAFRDGRKNSASFWITNKKGETILIQYFAVRDEEETYRGVIEVSQEITEIKEITGEKRLLNW